MIEAREAVFQHANRWIGSTLIRLSMVPASSATSTE